MYGVPMFPTKKDLAGDEVANDGAEDSMVLDEGTTQQPAPSEPASPGSSFLPTLLEPLLTLIQPTPLSFSPPNAPSPHPPTTSVLSAIHIAALECLNNAFLALAANPSPAIVADVAAGKKIWDEVWKALGAIGTEGGLGQEKRMEMWEIAVGVLWGVGIVWSGRMVRFTLPPDVVSLGRTHKLMQTPEEDRVKVLMQLCDSRADDAVRVKCIGTLESLAQHPESVDANRVCFMSPLLLRSDPID